MQITLTPQRRDDTLEFSYSGDVLTINGQEFDFSPLQEGEELPNDAIDTTFISGSVYRKDGEIHITLIEPHGPQIVEEIEDND